MRINFRQKDEGWNLFALLLYCNNNAYKTNHHDDLFMKHFYEMLVLEIHAIIVLLKVKTDRMILLWRIFGE